MPASLYEAFPPEEAKRLADRIEIHHTPKHGSWLNMAEIELSALGRQCLSRRIARQDPLKRQIAAWEDRRNAGSAWVRGITMSPVPASSLLDQLVRLPLLSGKA
jgi:hypothetical protein